MSANQGRVSGHLSTLWLGAYLKAFGPLPSETTHQPTSRSERARAFPETIVPCLSTIHIHHPPPPPRSKSTANPPPRTASRPFPLRATTTARRPAHLRRAHETRLRHRPSSSIIPESWRIPPSRTTHPPTHHELHSSAGIASRASQRPPNHDNCNTRPQLERPALVKAGDDRKLHVRTHRDTSKEDDHDKMEAKTKTLSLGTKLKYPITISKIFKKRDDKVTKQEALFQYKFTWLKEVGDPLGVEKVWQEKQTSYADWDSPVEGTVKRWLIYEGLVIKRDMPFVEVEELCSHAVQFQGLCALCGKDMMETNWATSSTDAARANVNMIHDSMKLKVSTDEASRAEEELQERLLSRRKLSLVVDLDQTIIHACIEPTVGEWQSDPTSPNYESVKDVAKFQLNDGPRGLASECWYYIKMRPGLKEFLNKIAEMYELHVYTMGTRAYALSIAKIVDPDKKLFGDRIISRDENGSITTKVLSRLFPVNTKMVVIIDDRGDVWPKNRPNLIKVVPYDFFKGIGDINSSFLPKREELPKVAPSPKRKNSLKIEGKQTEATNHTDKTDTAMGDSSEEKKPDGEESNGSEAEGRKRMSALEELVKMGSGDDQALLKEQAAEQEKFLEKQLTERPLLHLQEQLDKEEDEEESGNPEEQNGHITPEHPHPHHRHNLLEDDDVELEYLQQHLTAVHKAFYDEYDSALVNAHGGRVAQLKPGHNKKLSMKKSEKAVLKIVPDIGYVMPRLKHKVLGDCVIVMSGLVPLGADIMRTEIGIQVSSFGAEIATKVSRKVTHVVASTSRTRTHKVRQAAKYPNIRIVNQMWLLNSMSKWEKEDETPYLVEIHEADRIREEGFHSSASSINDSDTSSESLSEDDDPDGKPASQADTVDDDDVVPSDIEEGHSPIEALETFDWGGADAELAEFLGEDGTDSESEGSDTGSVTSNSSRASRSSIRSARGSAKKRKLDEQATGTGTDDDESDEESTLAKKQRIASSRTTGLQNVKTPGGGGLSEESLPTPGVTGDEGGGDVVGEGDEDKENEEGSFEDDLEADLMAAYG